AVRGDVRLIVSMTEDLWPVECDITELEVALMNLCVNARDAMPKGGLVQVTAHNETLATTGTGTPSEGALSGDFIVLSVTDAGTGIAPENIKLVFEPFFTTKEVGQGTGLGLSQVYGFAQQSGGTVKIDSQLGVGTSVILYLPRTTAMAQPETAPARPKTVKAS